MTKVFSVIGALLTLAFLAFVEKTNIDSHYSIQRFHAESGEMGARKWRIHADATGLTHAEEAGDRLGRALRDWGPWFLFGLVIGLCASSFEVIRMREWKSAVLASLLIYVCVLVRALWLGLPEIIIRL